MSNKNIITNYPTLNKFEIEWNGKKFSALDCDGIPKCCGSENINFNNRIACMKVRCQQMYNVEDNTRKEKIPSLGNCVDCTENLIDKSYCSSRGFLKNLLDPINITDCSSTLVNTGKNNIIEDVDMKVNCPDVTGNATPNVDVTLPPSQSYTYLNNNTNNIIPKINEFPKNLNEISSFSTKYPIFIFVLVIIIFLLLAKIFGFF